MKRHNNDDPRKSINSVHIEEVIDESLELLYGSTEDKLKCIHNVLALCQAPGILACIIHNHQLMSALARMFGEDSHLPTDLSFAIGKLFLAFSMIRDFHEPLMSYRVGALALGVVELELKRAWHRGNGSLPSGNKLRNEKDESKRTDISSEVAAREYTFSKKQEQVLFVCLGILDNLADDFGVLRKMVKKSLVLVLTRCLQQKTMQSMLVTLFMLKKASIFEETAIELSSNDCEVIAKLTCLLQLPCNAIHEEIIVVLLNLSFHDTCKKKISSESIHLPLVKLLRKHSLRGSTLQLMYNLSSSDENKQKFIKAEVSSAMLQLIKTIPTDTYDRGLAGFLVNITLHPLCCEELFKLDAIAHVTSGIRESRCDEQRQVLLKVARNLSQWTKYLQCKMHLAFVHQDLNPLIGVVKDPSCYTQMTEAGTNENAAYASLYQDHHFWDVHIDFFLHGALQCDSADLLVEWIGILNNLTQYDMEEGVQLIDLLNEHCTSLVPLLHNILHHANNSNRHAPCHDDLKLEVIIWIRELCTSTECSHWIENSNLIDDIHSTWAECSLDEENDDEMALQILSVYEQCLQHKATRSKIIEGNGELLAF